MVDLFRHFGRDRRVVNYEDLMGVMEIDGVEVENGDMLVLRTGFAELILEMNKRPDRARLETACAALDGSDKRLLQWISDSGLAAICADNYAVEHYIGMAAGEDCAALPLHEHCLFKLGLPLGELWYLADLANWLGANQRNRFMLTAPPLRLPKAVGSPVTPVGTV